MKKPFKAFHPFKLGVIIKAINSIWSPRKLFTNGEQGVWYDPSDLTTLYQDAAGTTPVTAIEQPVGLMLDKSKGLVLGPELVSNPGAPFTVATGWSGNVSATSGNLVLTTTGGFQGTSCTFLAVSGQTYKLSYSITSNTANWDIGVGNSIGSGNDYSGPQSSTPKTGDLYFKSTVTGIRTLWIYAYAAGTVTVDGISVRELPGNHAYQTVSTKRPVLSARANLLTKTERFARLPWAAYSATIQDNTSDTLDPIGGNNASKAIYGGASAGFYVEATMNTSYKYSIYAKKGTYDVAKVAVAYVTPSPSAAFNMTSGVASGVDCTASMTSIENDWWLCTIVFTVSGSARIVNYCGTTTGHNLYYFGASLVPANQSSLPYQRVNTATDYDTQGFPTYLKFDGIDDALQTNSIDFTATDKMTVFAGVRKLSDGIQIVAENGIGVGKANGTFGILQQPEWSYASRGTALSDARAASYAPVTNVLTGACAISTRVVTLRVNGTQAAISTADQGTGNYGNYPLYIGARAGTSLFFNGHLYNLIIRGAQSTAAQIESTEQWVNGKTAAF